MSYLSCPRFHFSGHFSADPSTVNNAAEHYAAVPLDRAAAWARSGANWNAAGRHAFRLVEDVRVRSAVGTGDVPVAGDPVLGVRFVSVGARPARLVDLDVDQQLVSTIFGLALELVDDDDNVLLHATMEPAAFTDFWGRLGEGDGSASVAYQSTLTVTEWGDLSASPLLTQLRSAAGHDLLSIKFNTDRYTFTAGPDFTRGRIVGTVGAGATGEPAHLVAGRQFGGADVPQRSDVNFFPALVDAAARRIRLDLGNALPEVTATSPVLTLAFRGDDGQPHDIAPIDYRTPNWYENTAGVVDLPVDPDVVKTRPLMVRTGQGAAQDTLIEETPVHVRADEFVARLDPGTQWTVLLHVTDHGEPLANKKVNLALVLPGQQIGAPVTTDVATHFPKDGLIFDDSVTTGGDGVATVTFTAADPGPARFWYTRRFSADVFRRQFVDGQVYLIGYGVDGVPPTNPSNVLSVLVWNTFVPDDPPTWTGSIGAILTRYGDLYPSMTSVADLADYDAVVGRRAAIVRALKRDVTDPAYMPVTRDLSGSRTKALLDWLQNLGPDGKPLFDAAGAVPPPAPPAPPPAREASAPEPSPQPDGSSSKTDAARGLGVLPPP